MDVSVDMNDFIQNDPVTTERNGLQRVVNELQALFPPAMSSLKKDKRHLQIDC